MMVDYRTEAMEALAHYWPMGQEAIKALPVPGVVPGDLRLPVQMREIELPDWGCDLGVQGCLLVPSEIDATGATWETVNWWWVIHWFLDNLAEREHERQHGPIHSYSFRLKGWDTRLWERAWVNRVALFLRRWAARLNNRDEQLLFGENPHPEILLTHDLDAINKTLAIRFKQTAFHTFNAVRAAGLGQWTLAGQWVVKALRFLISDEDYRHFTELHLSPKREDNANRVINVYGGKPGWQRQLQDQLFDPAYDVTEHALVAKLRELMDAGVRMGLHPSFASWDDLERMGEEKARLESAIGAPVQICRQHWLRFSFADTWRVQSDCGFQQDTTLGFNDRPGFRNGAALALHPMASEGSTRLPLEVWPLVLMDSHLYDYHPMDDMQRQQAIDQWVQEIKAVGGQATVLWHPHTLGRDYGWNEGFETLLAKVSEVCA